MIDSLLSMIADQVLRFDPEVHADFTDLDGKVFKIKVTGLGLYCYILPTKTGLKLTTQCRQQADVVIAGTPVALASMGVCTLAGGAKAHDGVTISGDAELAQELNQLLKKYHIDWEELLAKVFGDSVAHCVGSSARNVSGWGKDTACKMQQNFTDYLQEELRLLPTREAVEDFMQDVDQLRDDCARIEALLGQQFPKCPVT